MKPLLSILALALGAAGVRAQLTEKQVHVTATLAQPQAQLVHDVGVNGSSLRGVDFDRARKAMKVE